MGDLNIDQLTDSKDHKCLQNVLESFNLYSHIREPTRIDTRRGFNSKTAIDYVITNLNDHQIKYDVIEPHLSDHKGQIVTVKKLGEFESDTISEVIATRRSFSEQNMRNFMHIYSSSYDLSSVNYENINSYYSEFITHFEWCLNVACPKKNIKLQTTKKKKNPLIEAEIDKMKFLYYVAKISNDANLMLSYKNYKKSINKKIASMNIEENTRKIEESENKNKTMWRIVNERLGRKNGRKEINLKVNDIIIRDRKEICDTFVSHFATTVSNKLRSHFGSHLSTSCSLTDNVNHSIFITPVTENEIIDIINGLKNKYSTGIDDIPIKLLKFCKSIISQPIVSLINYSFEMGQFPDSLKLGKVIPILKKGDQCNVENYRPIVLLSCLSKIAEKSFANRIYSFMESNKIFTNCQYGYRAERSTELATLEFTQQIYSSLDKGKKVAGLFFDLTAAFDTVSSTFLQDKLNKLGIRGKALEWIVSYLHNRRIVMSLGSEMSEAVELTVGVGQGSILGPLLFLIFINDLPQFVISGDIYMYADDTSVIIHGNDLIELENKANLVILQFKSWCHKNSLIMNVHKTVFMHFSLTNTTILPKINHIDTSDQVKFLGTTIDSNLTFNKEIDSLCSKLAKNTFAILNLKKEINQRDLTTCYYSLVYSILSYNIIIWGQASETDRIFVLQKRIIRILFNLQYRESCRETFRKQRILTITGIYIFKISCFMHKNKKKFKLNTDIHNYQTRRAQEIHISNFNTSSFRKSPYCAGSYIYNKLPVVIRNATTFKIFRKKIQMFLIENCFYNLKEFFETC